MATVYKEAEERVFRDYVAMSLQLAPQGKYLSKSLRELLDPKPDYDADDVVERFLSKFEEVQGEST